MVVYFPTGGSKLAAKYVSPERKKYRNKNTEDMKLQ